MNYDANDIMNTRLTRYHGRGTGMAVSSELFVLIASFQLHHSYPMLSLSGIIYVPTVQCRLASMKSMVDLY